MLKGNQRKWQNIVSEFSNEYAIQQLYVRPHLDYDDVIYYIPPKICDFSQDTSLNNHMEKLESVQYLLHWQ